MENLVERRQFDECYRDRSVFVTGHTGFKGGWLATWLKMLGARVTGFALPPESSRPNLFEIARVGEDMVSILGDIRDCSALTEAFKAQKPEIVFHMAAQPLVRRSYVDPVETYATNVMGTVHLLEAVRHSPSVRVVVVVTSDKCYENKEWFYAYRENDPMGGYDPYSSSKAAAELVISSYRNSFFHPDRYEKHGVSVASVRAGNVIGGGDWSDDRLIPDCVRSIYEGKSVAVRRPRSIRPWQYVLEPLAGYLWLAARMWSEPVAYVGGWNFGPGARGNASVKEIVNEVLEAWGEGAFEDVSACTSDLFHEAIFLQLDSTKANNLLGWRPILSTRESVRRTVAWYQRYYFGSRFDGYKFTLQEIENYTKLACSANAPWAVPVLEEEHGVRRGAC